MTINGVEFDIDFTDAEFIEKIETASKEVYEKADKLKQLENISIAEGIRQECMILKDFLDYVLGDGTSEKLFKGKNSLELCFKAFEDIIREKEKSYNEFNERISKYSPERLKR